MKQCAEHPKVMARLTRMEILLYVAVALGLVRVMEVVL